MNHSETITIECTINGMPFQLHAAPGTPLSELLREQGTAKCQTRVLRG